MKFSRLVMVFAVLLCIAGLACVYMAIWASSTHTSDRLAGTGAITIMLAVVLVLVVREME